MRAAAAFRRRACGPEEDRPTVFIVDDRAEDRDCLRAIVDTVELDVATFSSAKDFLAARAAIQPGCLLLDLRLPGMDGLELQGELKRRGDGLPVIFITAYAEVATAVQAMKAGARDFLCKPVCERELLCAIRGAIDADRGRRARQEAARDAVRRLSLLSAREREVLDLVLEGRHSKDIGGRLAISARTVDVHRSNIIHKLGVTCLSDLYRLVRQADAGT